MKCIIISNRLPVTVVDKGTKFSITRSSGGLATGLNSLAMEADKHWIGWAGLFINDPARRRKMDTRLERMNLHSVTLTTEDIHDYYDGYSNSILWPLCHYFPVFMQYDQSYWRTYREVNELFCEEALKIIEPGDMVWIHDYHLMLLPAMIRARIPSASIGYFHHIPFPSYEIFRCLPERAEILHGLLGADMIGFHVHSYVRHFISALYRVLSLECHMDEVHLDNRVVMMEAFPMGINYEWYHTAITKPEVRAYAGRMKKLAGNCKIILSVDRLDYSKGIPLRIKGFADFLESNPDFRGKVSLLLVVVPSRDTVNRYAELKVQIDTLVGSINGKYAKPGWTPIFYYYRSFSFNHLCAMYNAADIALVTPLRDGMNLVAKEFVAAKQDRPGVLILSEMAGAAVELSEAVVVNPTDTIQIEAALHTALTMPEEEQIARLHAMQKTVARQSVSRWAGDFITELGRTRERNDKLAQKTLKGENLRSVNAQYVAAPTRLIMLDYDGTLAPFSNDPQKAGPKPALLALLKSLAADPRNTIVVCSGRDRDTLERWLGHLSIGITAEHGAFRKEDGQWHENGQPIVWEENILAILQQVTEKTPRSTVEVKKTALVWHFRDVDTWLADLRVSQLINALITPTARQGLQIMRGNKILEIKDPQYNKGTEARRLLATNSYAFVLAMGDDTTDEDMFAAMPESAVTIKVGKFSEIARYCLPSQPAVLRFLEKLAGQETVKTE